MQPLTSPSAEKLTTLGSISAPTSPKQFDAIIESAIGRYGKVLKDAGAAVN